MLPSGCHCSGFPVTADVRPRPEPRSSGGRFSTLTRLQQEDSSFQDAGGHKWRSFLSSPPLNALSDDRDVPGSALPAVMDGPRRSTVATVTGYR